MPRTYNYDFNDLEEKIDEGVYSGTFLKCEAIYSSTMVIKTGSIDGFGPVTTNSDGNHYSLTADGPATVADMKTGDIDDALTIALVFDEGGHSWQRQPTVTVTLTDQNTEKWVWTKSNEELR